MIISRTRRSPEWSKLKYQFPVRQRHAWREVMNQAKKEIQGESNLEEEHSEEESNEEKSGEEERNEEESNVKKREGGKEEEKKVKVGR